MNTVSIYTCTTAHLPEDPMGEKDIGDCDIDGEGVVTERLEGLLL